MKYTYQISFNGVDYSTLTPGLPIVMDGYWEDGTKIWREKISELKITKAENSTIYSTLESWFEDSTKFSTQIFVKILKNSVQESLHWFGIKWGKLNKELKTYEVEPIPYDYWSQYFESTNGFSSLRSYDLTTGLDYYGEGTTYPFVGAMSNQQTLEQVIKNFASEASGWSTANVVSSFLFADAYEDTSAVGTYNGMPLDYVTGVHSFLVDSSLITEAYHTFNEIIEWLKLLRVWIFFDSNNKLRFEHIKFFNDKLINNAVDYSDYIKSYNDEWSYEITSIPIAEKVAISVESDNTDVDFNATDIIYNTTRNRPDSQMIDYQYPIKTDLGYYGISISDNIFMISGIKNHIYKIFDVSMLTFSSTFNYLDVSFNSGLIAHSNDFYAAGGQEYSFNADMTTSFSGSYTVQIRDRSSSALISNTLTIVTAIGSGTITLTTGGTPTEDAYLRITGNSLGGNMEGWMTLEPTGTPYRAVTPTINGISSASPKSNGAFSVANIIDYWWKDDRLSRAGTINSVPYSFNSTQYNLQRKEIRVYITSIPNPLYGFNDGTRIGMIDKWTRDLDTDFYTIYLIYQEDE